MRNVQSKSKLALNTKKDKNFMWLWQKVKEAMGSDTGMTAKSIADNIETKYSKSEIPYSCKPDRNGKTSLLRNIETLLPHN